MFDGQYTQFAELLDQTCILLSKGNHKPDAQASAMWFRVLKAYELDAVRAGFDAHLRDPDRGRFVPVPADIIGKIHGLDGRPGSDEAWSIAVKAANESATVTWNDEIAEAWGVAHPIWAIGDDIGARMAFKHAYDRITGEAKRAGKPANWWPTLGLDPATREEEVKRSAALIGHNPALMLGAPDPQTLNRLAGNAPPHVREALLRLRDNLAASVKPEPEPAELAGDGATGPDLMTLGIVAVRA